MTALFLLGKNELIFLVAGVDFESEPLLRGLFLEEVGVSLAVLPDDENDDERNVRVCSLASSSAKSSSCRRIRSNSVILACSSLYNNNV